MKKLTVLLAVALIPLVGCVQTPDDKNGTSFCDGGCEQPENNISENNISENNISENNITPPVDLPRLKGAFISGHLGSYWDCPDEAFHPDAMANAEPGGDMDGARPEGDCAEDSCTGFTSCETAQVTISLSNGGETSGENILVDQIELLGTDGISRAILPLEATIDTTTNEPFDGTLAPGEEVIVRIEFQGPYNSWELLQPIETDGSSDGDRAAGGGGIIETTFSSDNHADLVVESGELYDIPAVDT